METEAVLAKGNCERIGIEGSKLTHKAKGKEVEIQQPMPNHNVAVQLVLKELTDKEAGVISSMDEIDAVGHRVVASGEAFKKTTLVTPEAMVLMEEIKDLAPCTIPPQSSGSRLVRRLCPRRPWRSYSIRDFILPCPIMHICTPWIMRTMKSIK